MGWRRQSAAGTAFQLALAHLAIILGATPKIALEFNEIDPCWQ
jgi:hypothetical protein